MSGRTPARVPPERTQLVRGLPHTYEMDQFSPGGTKSTVYHASSPQGALLRGATIEVHLPLSVDPPRDPLDPATWHRAGH
jgi:hypothetical protein